MSTTSDTNVVAAYFDKQSDAENAVRELQSAGFRADQIGSSFDDFDQEDYGDTTKASNRSLTSDAYSPNSATSTSSAYHESFWDKVKDFFSGETADSDINDHTITNREHTDISDRPYTASSTGWQSSVLRVPDTYHSRMNSGGGLVTVHANDLVDEAEQILRRNHGEIDRNFSDNFGQYQLGSEGQYAGTPTLGSGMGQGTRADITGRAPEQLGQPEPSGVDKGVLSSVNTTPMPERFNNASNTESDYVESEAASTSFKNQSPGMGQNDLDLDQQTPERRIQLISEVLRVRKERVARGEVRLRKEVRTETQNIQVPVTREEIVIERTPVDDQRQATGQIGADKEIRVPLSEERVQVDKVPVVTEEVKVGKRTVSNTQNVSDQVRREELDVEGADENLRKDQSLTDQNLKDKKDPKRKIA